MRFLNEGIAFAHLTLPPDKFLQEIKALKEELGRLEEPYSRHRISYLTGQADLLLELRLADLRLAFELEYDSSATGTNWLFAIPFDHAIHDGTQKGELPLTYVIHLRVNRDLYRVAGASVEEEIVENIGGLAQGKLSAEISAGFGWSDILVSGTFTRRNDFVKFLTGLHHMHLRCVNGKAAFRRILTIIGFGVDAKLDELESNEVLHPIIFARSLPTHIGIAADFLEWKSGGVWRKAVLDGKWDLVIILETPEGVPAKGFLKHHKSLITDGDGLLRAGIQRLETHLLSQEAAARNYRALEQEKPVSESCSCSSAVRDERELLGDPNYPKSSANLLPHSLVVAIRNVLNLFRAASRDATTCCDIVPSLVRCEIGLDRLLRHHRALLARMQSVALIDSSISSPASMWSEHVVKARNDIEEWCTYAERIVSQRTVGRFEEFLSQNERVVSYRGGIQKLLYLADALLNSYALRVFPGAEEPAFMSLYDPIDLVASKRVVGFVRVPVRYVFALPLAISHLWHEVGVHWFFAKYWMPGNMRTRRRVAMEFAKLTRHPTEQLELLVDLADVYGDAVTLIKGFRGDLTKFVVSVSSTLLESDAFRSAPPAVQGRFLVGLMLRLYLAAEFGQRCSFVRSKLSREALTFERVELDQWEPDRTVFVEPTVARLVAVLNRELLSRNGYKGIEITPEIVAACLDSVGTTVSIVHRQYLTELAWELGSEPLEAISVATHEALEAILKGDIQSLGSDVDINDLFMLVQQLIIGHLRDVPYRERKVGTPSNVYLQPVAALLRSSLLAFYHRDGLAERPRSGTPGYLRDLLRRSARATDMEGSFDLLEQEDV